METKGKGDFFEVVLTFDDNGELVKVEPSKNTEGYKVEEIKSLEGLKFYSSTVLLYGHGSPGYVIYKTSTGYIKVTKPQ